MPETTCDIAIVGAGPAGSAAAVHLARAGARVILIDRATFPRPKVCGCCLNAATIAHLNALGIPGLLAEAEPLHKIHLATSNRTVTLDLNQSRTVPSPVETEADLRPPETCPAHPSPVPWSEFDIPHSLALSRTTLDARLVAAARAAGAEVRENTTAALLPINDPDPEFRELSLRNGSTTNIIRARLVLAADGLAGGLLRRSGDVREFVSRNARLGAGCILPPQAAVEYPRGAIHMAGARSGYVGLVRLETGALDIAAALDPSLVRCVGGLAPAVAGILESAGWPLPDGLLHADWRGTPLLTRRLRQPGAHRALAIGDAFGYVEPFTGEGIGWALASVRAVTPIALEAVERWEPALIDAWRRQHARAVGRRQWLCGALKRILRHPVLMRAGLALLARAPQAARPILAHLNAPRAARHPTTVAAK